MQKDCPGMLAEVMSTKLALMTRKLTEVTSRLVLLPKDEFCTVMTRNPTFGEDADIMLKHRCPKDRFGDSERLFGEQF